MPRIRRISTLFAAALAVLILAQCASPSTTASPPTASPAAETASPSPAPTPSPTPTPFPTPTPSPTPTPDPAMEIVKGMSDEELLGQMVMLGFYGTAGVPKAVAEFYQKYKVGGLMLFGWNVDSFSQTKKLIGKVEALNQRPDLPLLVAIDEEGGYVHRFAWKPTTYSAGKLAERNDPQAVYDQFHRVGAKLRETGISVNLAPVLDISKNPPPFLGDNRRIYGSDPKKVIPLTNAAIQGTQDAGIASCGKHFPGHGGTATDSHDGLPKVGASMAELRGYALKPFAAAFEAGMEAVMVGHLLVPAIDRDWPATLSKKTITGLLREEMGFQGVVIADDMRMNAIIKNYDIGEACVRFVEAGGDVVLIGKFVEQQRKALKALDAAVKSGRLSRERLEESAYRIVRLKLKLKNHDADGAKSIEASPAGDS